MKGTESVVITGEYEKVSENDLSYENSYKGLPIHALGGLHEKVMSILNERLAKGAKILELASGTGAMALRCIDNDYRVSCSDIVQENFRLSGSVPFISANYNDYFSQNFCEQYDAILAIEIIEHIENPKHFLRQCRKLLKPGGIMVLSTPNVDSAASKAMFVRVGNFKWFSDEDYRHCGHITPLSQWYVEKSLGEAGFEVDEKVGHGDCFERIRSWRKLYYFSRLIRFISSPAVDSVGDISIYVAK